MNKVTRFFYGCFLLILPVVVIVVVIGFFYGAHTIITTSKSKFICIENYMYMRVEGSLLIYPNSVEPMRCEVFEYIEANKKEVK